MAADIRKTSAKNQDKLHLLHLMMAMLHVKICMPALCVDFTAEEICLPGPIRPHCKETINQNSSPSGKSLRSDCTAKLCYSSKVRIQQLTNDIDVLIKRLRYCLVLVALIPFDDGLHIGLSDRLQAEIPHYHQQMFLVMRPAYGTLCHARNSYLLYVHLCNLLFSTFTTQHR